jgi:hypothetical protein
VTAAAQPLVQERVRFGRDIPVDVNALLQQAAASTDDFNAAERALLDARALAPEQLEVFVALYKLYFYRGFTEAAEAVVLEALQTAASSGEFDPEWNKLSPASTDWQAGEGPARIYLYSLKALCFIRLRQQDSTGAADILAALHRLDPHDQVGASVLGELARAMEDI